MRTVIPLDNQLRINTLSAPPAGARWRTEAMRSHATARLIHITRGQGRMTIAGMTSGFGPNNLIYLPAGTMYGMELGPSVFGHMLRCTPGSDLPESRFHLRLRQVEPQREMLGLFEHIERELKPTGDLRAASCYVGLLLVFIARQLALHPDAVVTAQPGSTTERLVARYTALIGRDYGSGKNVTDYAALLNVTPTHLTRSCRQTSGRSASELLRDRIHYAACTLLQDTQTPIARIAADLGFRSAGYFTRSFQEKAGLTPSAFRRQHRMAATP